MTTIVFTVEASEGDKHIRVRDLFTNKDAPGLEEQVSVGERKDVKVFGSADEGSVKIYFTCQGKAEQQFRKEHNPKEGDNIKVPGCGGG